MAKVYRYIKNLFWNKIIYNTKIFTKYIFLGKGRENPQGNIRACLTYFNTLHTFIHIATDVKSCGYYAVL